MSGVKQDYDCAICESRVDTRFAQHWTGRNKLRPPLCACCERYWGKPAKDGSFADRRTVAAGSAIAEALESTAGLKLWEAGR